MKVKVKFASYSEDGVNRVVQTVNSLAKKLGVTYELNSKNQPNFLVDPKEGKIIRKSASGDVIHFENYTRVVSVIKDMNNQDEKLMEYTINDLKSQYKSLISKVEI